MPRAEDHLVEAEDEEENAEVCAAYIDEDEDSDENDNNDAEFKKKEPDVRIVGKGFLSPRWDRGRRKRTFGAKPNAYSFISLSAPECR